MYLYTRAKSLEIIDHILETGCDDAFGNEEVYIENTGVSHAGVALEEYHYIARCSECHETIMIDGEQY